MLQFDARLGQFTGVSAWSGSDLPKSSTGGDKRPWPLSQHQFPILSGDMLFVNVHGLPIGDYIDATSSTTAATPFPRPGLNVSPSLAEVALTSFATPQLPPGPSIHKEGGHALTVQDFLKEPREFSKEWKKRTSTLGSATPDLQEKVKAITGRLVDALALRATLLTNASKTIVGDMSDMAKAENTAAARISKNCVPGRADTTCLGSLDDASALSTRHRVLQVALTRLAAAVDISGSATAADSVGGLLDSKDARAILGTELAPQRRQAEINSPLPGPFKNPHKPTTAERAALKKALSTAYVVKQLADGQVNRYLRTSIKLDTTLRDNIATAAKDSAKLRIYETLKEQLGGIRSRTGAALDSIRSFVHEYELARLAMATSATHLAFAFDRGTHVPGHDYRLPIYRATGDEVVTITLTRRPRFAPPGSNLSLPTTLGVGQGTGSKSSGSNASGNSVQKSAQPAAGTVTYSQTLYARKRHYFQAIAGFTFTSIESYTFGTRDEMDTVTNASGQTQVTTTRKITRTSDRPREFVPAAQLVFQPFGKDLDPDAYRTNWVWVPGLAVGTSLVAPTKDFSIGLAWEFTPGLHLTTGFAWSQVQKLQDGFHTGSVIPSGASAPVVDKFRRGFYLGGMFDVTVFTDFFGKLLG